MSIIFFGTPEFAVPSLEALHNSHEKISLVITQPDKKKGRGHGLASPEVKTAALSRTIKVIQPFSLREQSFIAEVSSLSPEFIIVVAYGKILPKEILKIPVHGCINVHASLLPKYRGAAPVARAILKGEKTTGITTMLMDEGLDTGDILLQEEMVIDEDDTAATLSARLASLGAALLIKTLSALRSVSIIPKAQSGEASYAPPLHKEEGLIDWSRSAGELCSFVRGMHPWPGAYCTMGGERVTLLKVKPFPGGGNAGTIAYARKDGFMISTGHGLLSILELQPAGRKSMTGPAFVMGRRLQEGMRIS